MAKASDAPKLMQRAGEAAEKGNFDYAINLYLQVLDLTPEDIKARMALRGVEKARFDKSGAGSGAAVKAALAGFPNVLAAWIATLFKKHQSAARNYEKYLTRYPMSPFALWSLGRAFERAGYLESAIITYEFLRQNRPKHTRSLRRLARIYVERKDLPRAMQRYQMILQVNPRDIESLKQVHNLAAAESIQEGWDKGDTFQEKIRDKEKAVRLEQSQKTVRTTDQATDAVERVKIELKEKPDVPVLWMELGDLQRRRGELAEAEQAYRKAMELDPNNQFYLQKLMDVQLDGYTRRIDEARVAAEADPSNAALQAAHERAQKEKADFWLAELRRRADERPTETPLRFELGKLYFDLGLLNEATSEFQRVVRDAKYRLQATALLGKCFAAKGLDELAISQFEKVLLESSLLEPSGKDVAYNLGALYEKTGNLAAAEETYQKIFETDIGYLDIAERMERVYKKRRE